MQTQPMHSPLKVWAKNLKKKKNLKWSPRNNLHVCRQAFRSSEDSLCSRTLKANVNGDDGQQSNSGKAMSWLQRRHRVGAYEDEHGMELPSMTLKLSSIIVEQKRQGMILWLMDSDHSLQKREVLSRAQCLPHEDAQRVSRTCRKFLWAFIASLDRLLTYTLMSNKKRQKMGLCQSLLHPASTGKVIVHPLPFKETRPCLRLHSARLHKQTWAANFTDHVPSCVW